MSQKTKYFLTSTIRRLLGKGVECPSCGNRVSTVVARKHLVTSLNRCLECKLLYRTPVTAPETSTEFYQTDYRHGYSTAMPNTEYLNELISASFRGSDRDYSRHIDLLHCLGCCPGDRILDFGCSWGYGSWQFCNAGFDCVGLEVSKPRALFAQDKLGLDVTSHAEELDGKFDVFFSSHVIEHVPSVQDVFDLAKSVLRPGGWFVALTPNGSSAFRNSQPKPWQRLWGEVHPNFLDDVFYKNSFSKHSFYLSSPPYPLEAIQEWASNASESKVEQLLAKELLFITRFNVPSSTTPANPLDD